MPALGRGIETLLSSGGNPCAGAKRAAQLDEDRLRCDPQALANPSHLVRNLDARITSTLLRCSLQLLVHLPEARPISMSFIGGVQLHPFVVRQVLCAVSHFNLPRVLPLFPDHKQWNLAELLKRPLIRRMCDGQLSPRSQDLESPAFILGHAPRPTICLDSPDTQGSSSRNVRSALLPWSSLVPGSCVRRNRRSSILLRSNGTFLRRK